MFPEGWGGGARHNIVLATAVLSTISRMQVQAKTAPSGCTTNAVVRLTDDTTPVSVTISAASNDSGAIAKNYAAGASLTIAVQTAAAGCTTSPADANVTVQYRMQCARLVVRLRALFAKPLRGSATFRKRRPGACPDSCGGGRPPCGKSPARL